MSDARPNMKMLLAFVGLWAAEEALTALVLGRYGLAQVVWLRFVLHLVVLALVWGWREPALLWRTRRPLFQLGRASMMVAVPACWAMGMQRGLEQATLMSVFWLAPLMILGLAHLFLGEKVSRSLWLAAAAACVGTFALTGPHALPRPQLLVFPLGMALAFSLFVVMTRSLRSESVQANLFYLGLGVCVLLAPLMPSSWVTPTPLDLLIHAGIAILGLGGLFALERLTAGAPVARSAPLVYLQIPFAIAIGWSLEQPQPELRMLAGLMTIGAATLYVWRHQARRDIRYSADTGHGGLDTRA